MPRDLPVGNGSLLVNFDLTCQVRDIYWPHVGQENLADTRREVRLFFCRSLLAEDGHHTLDSGVMAEQVHPFTNAPLSVSPLTWSHATYVATLLEYRQKAEELRP